MKSNSELQKHYRFRTCHFAGQTSAPLPQDEIGRRFLHTPQMPELIKFALKWRPTSRKAGLLAWQLVRSGTAIAP